MHRARSQPGGQRKATLAIEDQQREILVLIKVAVKEAEHLLSMRWIVGGVYIEDDEGRGCPTGLDEQFGEIIIEKL